MSNKQQTAVEDLETQIEKLRFQGVTEWQCGYQKALNEVLFLLKQAKEMEKQKMIEFARNYMLYIHKEGIITIETFYNETYGGGEQ